MTIQKIARTVYQARNNAGTGYAPDFDSVDDVVADLVANYEGKVLCSRNSSDDVAVVRCGDGEIVLVGDAHGPWAVKCSAADLGVEVAS